MELTARARIGVTVALVAMLVAAGMVGYGVGYQRGHWDRTVSASTVRVPAQLSVPDLVGESLDSAGDRLRSLQFGVSYDLNGDGTGLVADQEPAPGTIVDRGAEVFLVEGGGGPATGVVEVGR